MRKTVKSNTIFIAPSFIAVLCIFAISFLLQKIDTFSFKPINNTIRFVVPSDKKNVAFSKYFLYKVIRNKHIDTYTISGNHKDDKVMQIVRYEALKNKFTCNSNTVIKVHFTSQSTYGQLVELASLMYEDKHKRYTLIDNDFYIFGGHKSDNSESE